MMKLKYVVLFFSFFIFPACDDLTSDTNNCSGEGTLEIRNNSVKTIIRIVIDGVNYGTLDAGNIRRITLPEGKYEIKLPPINGGLGCPAAAFATIRACKTIAWECRN